MTAAARFAAHAIDTRFADLSDAAVRRAKVFVFTLSFPKPEIRRNEG